MRYTIEPKDRIYVKGYGFFSFAENMGTKERYISPEKRQQIIGRIKASIIIMEYQKLRNLLDNASN